MRQASTRPDSQRIFTASPRAVKILCEPTTAQKHVKKPAEVPGVIRGRLAVGTPNMAASSSSRSEETTSAEPSRLATRTAWMAASRVRNSRLKFSTAQKRGPGPDAAGAPADAAPLEAKGVEGAAVAVVAGADDVEAMWVAEGVKAMRVEGVTRGRGAGVGERREVYCDAATGDSEMEPVETAEPKRRGAGGARGVETSSVLTVDGVPVADEFWGVAGTGPGAETGGKAGGAGRRAASTMSAVTIVHPVRAGVGPQSKGALTGVGNPVGLVVGVLAAEHLIYILVSKETVPISMGDNIESVRHVVSEGKDVAVFRPVRVERGFTVGGVGGGVGGRAGAGIGCRVLGHGGRKERGKEPNDHFRHSTAEYGVLESSTLYIFERAASSLIMHSNAFKKLFEILMASDPMTAAQFVYAGVVQHKARFSDLQKGERYASMAFITLSTVRHHITHAAPSEGSDDEVLPELVSAVEDSDGPANWRQQRRL
ncbi:hypothetical protein C8R43DRAFT_964891 [Mycena crocata]|nr:hypothetical protein C8R43DRAFT_964891 [Mycena crocata]